jgi:uncharacterized coiled-coil DUF342 family protein
LFRPESQLAPKMSECKNCARLEFKLDSLKGRSSTQTSCPQCPRIELRTHELKAKLEDAREELASTRNALAAAQLNETRHLTRRVSMRERCLARLAEMREERDAAVARAEELLQKWEEYRECEKQSNGAAKRKRTLRSALDQQLQ